MVRFIISVRVIIVLDEVLFFTLIRAFAQYKGDD